MVDSLSRILLRASYRPYAEEAENLSLFFVTSIYRQHTVNLISIYRTLTLLWLMISSQATQPTAWSEKRLGAP